MNTFDQIPVTTVSTKPNIEPINQSSFTHQFRKEQIVSQKHPIQTKFNELSNEGTQINKNNYNNDVKVKKSKGGPTTNLSSPQVSPQSTFTIPHATPSRCIPLQEHSYMLSQQTLLTNHNENQQVSMHNDIHYQVAFKKSNTAQTDGQDYITNLGIDRKISNTNQTVCGSPCRICLDEDKMDGLISKVCLCSQPIHQDCLGKWILKKYDENRKSANNRVQNSHEQNRNNNQAGGDNSNHNEGLNNQDSHVNQQQNTNNQHIVEPSTLQNEQQQFLKCEVCLTYYQIQLLITKKCSLEYLKWHFQLNSKLIIVYLFSIISILILLLATVGLFVASFTRAGRKNLELQVNLAIATIQLLLALAFFILFVLSLIIFKSFTNQFCLQEEIQVHEINE